MTGRLVVASPFDHTQSCTRHQPHVVCLASSGDPWGTWEGQWGDGGTRTEVPASAAHSAVTVLYPQLFCKVGNCVANQFWAANVPPSEAIHTASRSQERRHFLVAKYKEGKYRRYHPLFGNQEELNKVGA